MIDTIALTLNEEMFTILDHNRFSPSTNGLYRPPYYTFGGRGRISCYQNPTTTDLRNGIYKPRLTATRRITRGGFEKVLKIEFSAPKLLFGNNFDELTEEHFPTILLVLKDRLKEMGVLVRNLEIAPVSVLHCSKNIILTDGSTPHGILRELSKANFNMRMDTNQTDYRNEGHSYKFRTNSSEVAFYDKLKDLRQAKLSPKRAIEYDNEIQLSLFDEKTNKSPFEVLRMEVRLNSRTKIRQVLKGLDVVAEPLFNVLFSKDISQGVLTQNWEAVESNYKLLEYKPKDNGELLSQLLAHNPDLTARKAMQFFGLKIAIEELGIREFRQITERGDKKKSNAWYKLHKEAKDLIWPQSYYSPMRAIKEAIRDFEQIKLKDYESAVYNVT